MSSERVTRMDRILGKLESAVATGNYYEAHQMYRTLYFRYISQKKYDLVFDLLYNGSLKLMDCGQFSSAADLTLLLIEALEKSKVEDYEAWMQKLAVLLVRYGPNVAERETIFSRAIKWSIDVSPNNFGHPTLHKLIARIMWTEGNLEQARHHYLLSKDGASCGQMLVQLSDKKGYAVETDLFIAQAILQQLCLKEAKTALQTFETYTKYHPKIACSEPPFLMPLLNFIYFLLKTVETGRLVVFKSLCSLYKASLDRDPSYEKYLQKIGVIFFGALPPQQPGMGGLFGDLFNRFLQSIEDDNGEGDSDQRQTTNSTLNAAVNATELD